MTIATSKIKGRTVTCSACGKQSTFDNSQRAEEMIDAGVTAAKAGCSLALAFLIFIPLLILLVALVISMIAQ